MSCPSAHPEARGTARRAVESWPSPRTHYLARRRAGATPNVSSAVLLARRGRVGAGSARDTRPTRLPVDLPVDRRPCGGRDGRRCSSVDRADDLAAVEALQVNARDGEVRVLDIWVICLLCQGTRRGTCPGLSACEAVQRGLAGGGFIPGPFDYRENSVYALQADGGSGLEC
jgi:hypothetical protein